MDMSPAALPPRQPYISAADRAHPRFNEYQVHLSSCARLLIQASSFADWLGQTERQERDNEIAKDPLFPAFQKWMRENQGGARRCPAVPGSSFPGIFEYWRTGGRW